MLLGEKQVRKLILKIKYLCIPYVYVKKKKNKTKPNDKPEVLEN